MEEIRNMCRFCLNFGDELSSDSSDLSLQEKLKKLLPALNLNNPNEYIICSMCRTLVENALQFAQNFSKNNELIEKEKKRLNIVTGINLNRMVKKYKLSDCGIKDKALICRFCFSSKVGSRITLSHAYKYKNLKYVMNNNMFAMDKDLTVNPIICESCQKELRKINGFIKLCNHVERELGEYSKKSTEVQIDLRKFKDFLRGQARKNCPSELLEDKKPTQASTVISSKTDNNRKRSLPEEGSNMVPAKKQKLPILGKRFPHSVFLNKFVDTPTNFFKLNDWLSSVSKMKKVLGWSNSVTVDNVLENLKEMDEIHTYFSNISRTHSWEQWRNKLTTIFPNQNDYGILLKSIRYRVKLPNESYVQYYNVKMQQLKAANIRGEDAVSCLLGCLTDRVVACFGKSGNYKKPGQLLAYFKTCDEKEGLNECVKPKKKQDRCQICKKRSHVASECPSNLGRTMPKQTENRSVKRNQNDGKNTSGTKSKEQNKQRHDGGFVKPLPPKSTSSATLQGKGSGLSKPSAQKEIRAGSISAAKQSEVGKERPNPQSKGDRDTSGTRLREHSERRNTATSAATTQEWRKKNDSNVHWPGWQDWSGKSAELQTQNQEIKKSHLNRGVPESHDEEVHPTTSAYDFITLAQIEDYVKSHMSAASQQNRREDTYFSRDVSSARSRRYIDESYVNKDTCAASVQNRREKDYFGSVRSMASEDSYLDSGMTGGRSQSQYKESDVNRARFSIGPNKEGDVGYVSRGTFNDRPEGGLGSYAMKRLLNSRFQERGDPIVDIHEVETGYTQRFRPQEIEGAIDKSISNDRWREELRGRYDNRGSLRTRSPMHDEGHNVYTVPSGYRLQEIGDDAINQSIPNDRWQEKEELEGGYADDYIRSRSPLRSHSHAGPDRIEGNEVSMGVSSDRWREIEEEGYFNRDGILRSRSPMRDERYTNRKPFGTPRQSEIKVDTVNQNISSDREWDERYNNEGLTLRSTMRNPPLSRGQKAKGGKDINISSDGWREERYDNREGIFRSPMHGERYADRSPSGGRPLEIDEDNVNQNKFSDGWPEERYVNKEGIFTSPMQDQRHTNRSPFGVRPQEVEEGNANQSKFSDRWREDEDQIGRYANRDSLGVKPQDYEGSNVYRPTFGHSSPVCDEPSNVERMPPSATPKDEWELSYVDRNISGFTHGEQDQEGSVNIAAPGVRLPTEKEMIGSGFSFEMLMERSYLNKDASSARPSDINYPSRVAPTDNSRKFSQGSYLNKPTPATPREILPGNGEGNNFNKSISSTGLLGPTLGNFFSAIPASRSFTSYPSSATTAKPLALNRGGYFSRDLLEYNDGKRGASGEINSQRGQDLAKNNYSGRSSTANHQEQSHRELCLRCYTIGHKSEYCPQFRT